MLLLHDAFSHDMYASLILSIAQHSSDAEQKGDEGGPVESESGAQVAGGSAPPRTTDVATELVTHHGEGDATHPAARVEEDSEHRPTDNAYVNVGSAGLAQPPGPVKRMLSLLGNYLPQNSTSGVMVKRNGSGNTSSRTSFDDVVG